jgi:hypothetical protein
MPNGTRTIRILHTILSNFAEEENVLKAHQEKLVGIRALQALLRFLKLPTTDSLSLVNAIPGAQLKPTTKIIDIEETFIENSHRPALYHVSSFIFCCFFNADPTDPGAIHDRPNSSTDRGVSDLP